MYQWVCATPGIFQFQALYYIFGMSSANHYSERVAFQQQQQQKFTFAYVRFMQSEAIIMQHNHSARLKEKI